MRTQRLGRTLFHLVRHGAYALVDHALGGRASYTLSPQGREQADRIAAVLKPRGPALIVSSPVQRCRETAELIADRLSLDLQIDDAFAEIEFAHWTGRRFEDLQGDPAWQAWNSFRSTAVIPGGETMLATQARAVAGLMHHAGCYPNDELVIVSHADVIKAVLAHFLGTPLDLMCRIEISPGSISQLILLRDDAKVLAINIQP